MPESSLTITDLRITPVAIADPPIRSSYGLHQPYALRAIVELVSGDGVIGVSETYGGEEPMKALEGLRDQIIGADPYRLTGTLASLVQGREYGGDASQTYLVPGENPLDATSRTYAAVEVGCLDLIGKSVGVPVCDLIGGRVRDKVPFSAYPFYKHAGGGGEGEDARPDKYGECLTPDTLVGQVVKMREEYGFGSIKFKAGVLPPEEEIETVKGLYRELGPEVPLASIRTPPGRSIPRSAWAGNWRRNWDGEDTWRTRRLPSTGWPKSAAACSPRGSKRPSPVTLQSPVSGIFRSPFPRMPSKSFCAIIITGVACVRCKCSPTYARLLAWACPCIRTITSGFP